MLFLKLSTDAPLPRLIAVDYIPPPCLPPRVTMETNNGRYACVCVCMCVRMPVIKIHVKP